MIAQEWLFPFTMAVIMGYVFTDAVQCIRSTDNPYLSDLIWVGSMAASAGVAMICWIAEIFI